MQYVAPFQLRHHQFDPELWLLSGWNFSCLHGFAPGSPVCSQKAFGRWTTKMPHEVTVFLPYTQSSSDQLQIDCDSEQDNELTEDEQRSLNKKSPKPSEWLRWKNTLYFIIISYKICSGQTTPIIFLFFFAKNEFLPCPYLKNFTNPICSNQMNLLILTLLLNLPLHAVLNLLFRNTFLSALFF